MSEKLGLSYGEYYRRVYGGWLGKCIGGAVGARVEGQKRMHSFTEEDAFPEEWPPNDDLDLQVLWLHTLQERGLNISSMDLAEEWWEHCWYDFNEYGRFLKNFSRGIDPPTSGWFDNEYFRESMGSPIRSEIWGFICPNNPSLAARYASMDACLDHWKNSIWAEQFLAAMESSAFNADGMEELVDAGLRFVPPASRLGSVVSTVRSCYLRGLSWVDARSVVLRKFGSPDFTSVFQNIGFILIALLWGELDFGKTMLIALNCGYDTDCTCATAGALLGALLGADAIPCKWREPIGDEFEMGFPLPRRSNRISDLAHETCAVGVALSKTLNYRVEVLDVPEEIGTMAEKIASLRPEPGVELSVGYNGPPAMGRGETRKITICLENGLAVAIEGTLSLDVPKGWKTSGPSRISVMPHSTQVFELTLEAPSKGILWNTNIFRVEFTDSSGRSWSRRFGMCGSRIWGVIGPYYEAKSWIEDSADVDVAYVDERLIEDGREPELFSDCVVLESPESTIPLESILGFRGECCVYLLHRMYSPDDRNVSVVVGAAGDVKVWVNGRLVGRGSGKTIWNPRMYRFGAHLKRGENRIVLKYAKKVERPKLSFDVYVPNREKRPRYSCWQTDLGTVL